MRYKLELSRKIKTTVLLCLNAFNESWPTKWSERRLKERLFELWKWKYAKPECLSCIESRLNWFVNKQCSEIFLFS